MTVSTDQLFVILLGAGASSPDSYAFCINRPIDDIALCISKLGEVEGVKAFTRAERGIDNDGNAQTVVEVIFDGRDNMPAVFGRIAVAFAEFLGLSYRDTLLFREVVGGDSELSELSFMELPDYAERFPGVFPAPIDNVEELLEDIARESRMA